MANVFQDEPVCLISDAASLKHDSAIAVMASCSKLSSPVILSLITPIDKSSNEDNDTYDYQLAAKDIRKVAQEFNINIDDQVTNMMGDNVAYNKCIADELGVTQGKCLPHALALVVKHGYGKIPHSKELIIEAGAIISAGGTNKRRNELRNEPYNLNPNELIAYTNRFADVTKKAQYRLLNFTTVREWHLNGATIAVDVIPDTGDDTPARARRVRQAYEIENHAKVSLGCHVTLFGNIPDLVKDLSAEFDNPNSKLTFLKD